MQRGYQTLLLLRFSEIAIKSQKTRRWLTNQLINHIKYVLMLYNYKDFEIIKEYSRIFIRGNNLQIAENIITSLVPGIKSVSYVFHIPTDKTKIKKIILDNFLPKIRSYSTFAVKVKRVGKHHFTSVELAAELGEYILDNLKDTEIRVNLTNPDYTLKMEVRDDDTYVFDEKTLGLGGLPAECQGKVLVISDKISKEEVSITLQMYKRGANTLFYYFGDRESIEEEKFYSLNLLLHLQQKLIKKAATNDLIIFGEMNIEKIIDLYKKEEIHAIVMSKELFYKLERSIPINIPIFVPHLVWPINNKELKRIEEMTKTVPLQFHL